MPSPTYKCSNSLEQEASLKIVDKYNQSKNNSKVFRFSQIKIDGVKKLYQILNLKKSSQKDDIKTNLLRENAELFSKYSCDNIKDSTHFSKFPTKAKQADIIPAKRNSRSYLKKVKVGIGTLGGSGFLRWDFKTPCIKNSEYQSQAKKKKDSDFNFYDFSLLVPYPNKFLVVYLPLYPYFPWYILPPTHK